MKDLIDLKVQNKKSLVEWMKQFIKFGIVGLSNTIISFVIYYVLIYFEINYIIANTMGFVISVLNAFYWNNKYVFRSDDERGYIKRLVKTFVSYGGTFALSTTLLIVMVDYLNISEMIAPIINLIVTVPLNFLLNKLWAFK